jgi:hypothetical protein
MRLALVCFLAIFVSQMAAIAQTPEKFAEIWDKEHVSHILPSDVRHADLKVYLDGLKKLSIDIREVGRSGAGREIYQAEWGHGPLKVFMWSQMHGDEPTATSALIDMLTFLQKNRTLPWVKKIDETMTLRIVPMLNPDGAEIYQRRNLQNIDINRDAVDLKTPEARLLKQLRDDWRPEIGFNLHNQNALTAVGGTANQATISLLVVYGDAAKTTSPGQERNTRIVSAIIDALQKFIPGHIAKYGDEYTSTAFGDNFSAWGTPTILIETGALYGKDEMYLVKLNFVAYLTALQSLATGSEAATSTVPYLNLLPNSSGGIANFVFRRANIVSADPLFPESAVAVVNVADIAANTERRRASFSAPVMIRSISPGLSTRGLEEYDASGFNVVQRYGRVQTGELAELFFYKRDRQVDWFGPDIEKRFPPDAVFSLGKWVKGAGVVPKIGK